MRFFGKLIIWIVTLVTGYIVVLFTTDHSMAWVYDPSIMYIDLLKEVLIYAVAVFLAIKMSRLWEKFCCKRDVAIISRQAAAEGKTRREYLREHTPHQIIEICEKNYRKKELMELLLPQVDYKVISKGTACALVEEFGINQ